MINRDTAGVIEKLSAREIYENNKKKTFCIISLIYIPIIVLKKFTMYVSRYAKKSISRYRWISMTVHACQQWRRQMKDNDSNYNALYRYRIDVGWTVSFRGVNSEQIESTVSWLDVSFRWHT